MPAIDIDDGLLEAIAANKENKIFQISYLKKYIEIWSNNNKLQDCSICKLALDKYKCTVDTFDWLEFVKRLDNVASQMPQDIIGILFTWMYIQYVGKPIITEEEALQIDPLSILFHCIIGCCSTQMGIDYHDKKLQHLLQLRLSKAKVKRLVKDKASSKISGLCQGNIKDIDKVKKKKKMKYRMRGKREEKDDNKSKDSHIKDLTEYIKTFATSAGQFRKKNKINSCKSNSMTCIYENGGYIDNFMEYKNLIEDCRVYVAKDWIYNVLKLSYHEFMSSENFALFQPGLFKQNQNSIHSDVKKDNFTTSKDPFYYSLQSRYRGFLIKNNSQLANNKETHDKYIKINQQKTCNLLQRLHYIIDVIKMLDSNKITNTNSSVCIIMKRFPFCKWCDFSIDKAMRYIINDLYVMCHDKAINTGLNIQWSNIQPFRNNNTDNFYLYGLGLTMSSISEPILKEVFHEWYTKKFPFLSNCIHDKDIDGLLSHQDPISSIYCVSNRRRIFVETFQNIGNRSKCYITSVIKILQYLLTLNIKLAKEKEAIRKIAWDHNIPM